MGNVATQEYNYIFFPALLSKKPLRETSRRFSLSGKQMSQTPIHSPREFPVGIVTFLFTDIEGSTKMWQDYPAAMPAALARHHAILNQAIAARRGMVFQIVGDAFHAAFASAFDAIAA